jgi:hypothetical protein
MMRSEWNLPRKYIDPLMHVSILGARVLCIDVVLLAPSYTSATTRELHNPRKIPYEETAKNARIGARWPDIILICKRPAQ